MTFLLIAGVVAMMLVNIAAMAASRGGFSRAQNVAFYVGAAGVLSIPAAIVPMMFGGLVWAIVGTPAAVERFINATAAIAVLCTIVSLVLAIGLRIRRRA